jgi:hypothetical protein
MISINGDIKVYYSGSSLSVRWFSLLRGILLQKILPTIMKSINDLENFP